MPARCGMFDTPGVPHAHQLAAYLDPEEVNHCCMAPLCAPPESVSNRECCSAVFRGGADKRGDKEDTGLHPASCCAQVRMLLPRKPLKPRTFRIAPGQV